MTELLTGSSRIALFRSVVDEERWTSNEWHRHDGGDGGGAGKDYLCLAAAWGKPGEINGTGDCPTDLFPAWLFELMPFLDDGVAKEDVPWLFKGFAERAEGMAKLSPETWDRIQTGFMIGVARQALESATPVQPDPKPEYWQAIVDAVERVAKALEAGDPEELKAAEAAARAAARAAAWAAARAAARAAEAAAWAAAWAAARAAARAAEAAAWAAAIRKMAELLFALIDAEIDG